MKVRLYPLSLHRVLAFQIHMGDPMVKSFSPHNNLSHLVYTQFLVYPQAISLVPLRVLQNMAYRLNLIEAEFNG
jgi:hypothetical protein